MSPNNAKNTPETLTPTQNQPRTQIGDLRELLTKIERRVARLQESSPAEAVELLSLLDQAKTRLAARPAGAGPISSEEAQFTSLLMQFDKKGALFISRAGGPAALRQARQAQQPAEAHWWWFIDQTLAQKRRSKIKRWSIGTAIVSVVLVVLAVIYNQFLAPDPVFQAGIGYQQTAENKLIAGRYEEALDDVNLAIEHLPDYPELLVMRGVIYEVLDEPVLAEESYQLGWAALDKEETFRNERTKYYLMANQPAKAIEDAQLVLARNPDSAITFLYLGQAHELKGDLLTAIEYYETASEAADRTENAQLQVFAKMNLAQALQALQVSPPTPLPVEE